MSLPPLLLLGCGKMGGAMLAGWLEQGLPPETVVVEPHAPAVAAFAGRVRHVATPAEIPAGFAPGAVILATKPQEAPSALPPLARFAGPGVTEAQRALCDRLLGAVGESAWVEEEGQLDAVTAVSGGGPAYVFLLAEVLEAAALAEGLPPELARRMARATVSGSGALLAASAEDAAQLRRNVTSPKGTTERALAVLMREEAWPALMREAIAAATARSRELAG